MTPSPLMPPPIHPAKTLPSKPASKIAGIHIEQERQRHHQGQKVDKIYLTQGILLNDPYSHAKPPADIVDQIEAFDSEPTGSSYRIKRPRARSHQHPLKKIGGNGLFGKVYAGTGQAW